MGEGEGVQGVGRRCALLSSAEIGFRGEGLFMGWFVVAEI